MKKITKEYPNESFVLEGWHVYPDEISKLFCNENVKIICLGYTKISCEESAILIRKNEKENSYTKKISDEKLKELVSNHIEYSKILKKQCEKKNIKFYDTSFERNTVLEEAIAYIIDEK